VWEVSGWLRAGCNRLLAYTGSCHIWTTSMPQGSIYSRQLPPFSQVLPCLSVNSPALSPTLAQQPISTKAH
jgi:hypothetical protein